MSSFMKIINKIILIILIAFLASCKQNNSIIIPINLKGIHIGDSVFKQNTLSKIDYIKNVFIIDSIIFIYNIDFS